MDISDNIESIFKKALIEKNGCLYIKENFKIDNWTSFPIDNKTFSFLAFFKRMPYFSLKLINLCGNSECLDPEHLLESTEVDVFPELHRDLDEALDYFEKNGFPFYKWNNQYIKEKLETIKIGNLIPKNNHSLGLNNKGVALANAFHPQMDFVNSSLYKSPMEAFNDKTIRTTLIKGIFKKEGYISENNLRRSLFSKGNYKKVSNFNPLTAKYIYNLLKPKLVLDFSMGWGGRMLGAVAANVDYIGIDPSTFAINSNKYLLEEVKKHVSVPEILIIKDRAEYFLGNNTYSPDLIFSSPPYFDLEHYSPEKTQSYLSYPDKEMWFEEFLNQVIKRSYIDLKENGYLVLNVSNNMTSRTLNYGIKAGFVLKESLILSLVSRNLLKKLNTNKEEIILFFKKEIK